jgi:hypothetical protein
MKILTALVITSALAVAFAQTVFAAAAPGSTAPTATSRMAEPGAAEKKQKLRDKAKNFDAMTGDNTVTFEEYSKTN